ncbi:hypothetical protein NDU88_006199 [Pleurodeles waltl]|uniref:Uncharacterized protein n=1 Tax=Pleurodeles waltl TaxID=8319 RepID=A0AAV7MC68_PLEWA|nr:hypothetical protein NDU88_006199 [Pleurodeles waltl]
MLGLPGFQTWGCFQSAPRGRSEPRKVGSGRRPAAWRVTGGTEGTGVAPRGRTERGAGQGAQRIVQSSEEKTKRLSGCSPPRGAPAHGTHKGRLLLPACAGRINHRRERESC